MRFAEHLCRVTLYGALWMIWLKCCFTGIYPEQRERLLQRAQAAVMEDLQRKDNAGRMVGIYDRQRKAERWQKKSVGCYVNKRENRRQQKWEIRKLNKMKGKQQQTQHRRLDDNSGKDRAQESGRTCGGIWRASKTLWDEVTNVKRVCAQCLSVVA